jgi:hypothetical protein
MEETADRRALAKFIVTLNGCLSLQDLNGNAAVREQLQSFRTNAKTLPDALG